MDINTELQQILSETDERRAFPKNFSVAERIDICRKLLERFIKQAVEEQVPMPALYEFASACLISRSTVIRLNKKILANYPGVVVTRERLTRSGKPATAKYASPTKPRHTSSNETLEFPNSGYEEDASDWLGYSHHGEHRWTGSRARCFQCNEWCYPGNDVKHWCPVCELDWQRDQDAVPIPRETLRKWAQTVADRANLDTTAAEIEEAISP